MFCSNGVVIASGVFLVLFCGCGRVNNGPERVGEAGQARSEETTREQLSVLELCKCISLMPPWTKIGRSGAAERDAVSQGLAFIAAHDIRQVRAAIILFVKERGSANGTQNLDEVSKLFVLNRYLFAVPTREDVENVRFFGGWGGVPEADHAVDMMWPLAPSDRGPELVGYFRGYSGDWYDGLAEFDFLYAKYGIRTHG